MHAERQSDTVAPMQSVDLTVRCMVWQEGGLWVAACVDLTLAAQGASAEEARRRLHAQIAGYVAEAFTVDAAHAHELLARRAPLRDLVRFAFWDAVTHRPRLRRTAGRIIRHIGLALQRKLAYSEPLPLRVA